MHRVVIVLLALMTMLAVAGTGHAFCLYNHSRLPLHIAGPDANWIVAPSNHRCTDGTGGQFSLQVLTPFRKCCSSQAGNLSVHSHGWISVYPEEGGQWRAVSKKKDGSVEETIYLDKYKP